MGFHTLARGNFLPEVWEGELPGLLITGSISEQEYWH
jgi:hypothetical protein